MDTKTVQEFVDCNDMKCISTINFVEEIKCNNQPMTNPTNIKQEVNEFCNYASINIKQEEIDIKEETTNVNETVSTSVNVTYLKQEACDEKSKPINKAKRFLCQTCSRTFATKSNLVSHLRIHTGEKPFNCKICNYRATQSTNLKTHMMIHTGDKPFSCTLCNYKCTREMCLTNHVRNMHTLEGRFECYICDYTCTLKSRLTYHLKSHPKVTPFRCTWCSFSCIQKSLLTHHLKTHTGEKPHHI